MTSSPPLSNILPNNSRARAPPSLSNGLQRKAVQGFVPINERARARARTLSLSLSLSLSSLSLSSLSLSVAHKQRHLTRDTVAADT